MIDNIQLSLPAALAHLSQFRKQNSRESQEVFTEGVALLDNAALWKKGDEVWPFLEQLALASVDVGRLDIADRCISSLLDQFPGSPRVDCLIGIRKEASQSPTEVLEYYDELLAVDETDAAAWKRKISLLRRTGQTAKAIEELSQFLETFYSDVDAWIELADIYAECNQYEHALKSLQHALLLAPQNPFFVLQAAETAYTAGDVPLALKTYLIAVDMSDADADGAPADSIPDGITVRGWYGVKLCTRKLLDQRLPSQTQTKPPELAHLKLLDELSTERLLTAYSGGDGSVARSTRDALVRWLERR